MTDPPVRLFTVGEANDLLGVVRPVLERLREAHAAMEALHEDVMEGSPTNGGGRAHAEFLEASTRAAACVRALQDQGIIVRDAEAGLIDFPSKRGDDYVYLCWRLGEDRVAWWHPVDSGFSGRQPLP